MIRCAPNVGFLCDSVSRLSGGMLAATRELAFALSSAGCAVHVVGVRDSFTDADAPGWGAIPIRISETWGPRAFGFAPTLARQLEEVGMDVLMPQGLWTYCSIASHRWQSRLRRPNIVHPHGMLDPWALRNSWWKKKLAWGLYEGRHLRSASCFRALNLSECDAIRRLGLRNPIAVVPNGVTVPPPEKLLKSGCGGGASRTLLYLGRLHPKKGLVPLLKAWAALGARARKDWHLVVLGWDQGGHDAELMQLCEALELPALAFSAETETMPGETPRAVPDGSVLFGGPVFGEAKGRWLARADAMVLPSFSEGLPMAVLEAWAHGRPVLMTPQCNLPEGFAAGAALRMDHASDDALAQGLVAGPQVPGTGFGEVLRTLFAMSEADRDAMGARGRRMVEERYSWSAVASEMKAVCDWAVGGGAPPPCVDRRRG